MSWGYVAIAGATLVAGWMGSQSAKKAGEAQQAGAEAGIAEERRQFDAITELLAPYVQAGEGGLAGLSPYAEAGEPALQQQQALLGLHGARAQQEAIEAIEQGGMYQGLVRQGEEAILQQASATGGLRGGNTQAALAQFRPQMLSQAINEQYSRLGGMTALGQQTQLNLAQLGQAAAARQAAAGQQSAANISGLYGQMGAAQAGSILGQGQAWQNTLNQGLQLFGMWQGGRGFGGGATSGTGGF